MTHESKSYKPVEARKSDKQSQQNYKKIFRRIGHFQEYLDELCNLVSNYAVKAAGLRDKNDEVAKCLAKFTKVEEFSTTSKLSMAVTAELVATVGDHEDMAIQRMETLVLPNLSSYGRICKCIKADVLNALEAKSRENGRRKQVKTLKKKAEDPKYKKVVNDAERELERASAETSRLCQLSQEQVIKFEHKRLMDLKESLGNFIRIQIATHAKSLELLSAAYRHIQSIDEDADLEILKTALHLDEKASKKTKEASGKSKESIKQVPDHNESNSASESSHEDVVRSLEKVLGSNSSHKCEKRSNKNSSSEKHKPVGDAQKNSDKKVKSKRKVSSESESFHSISDRKQSRHNEVERKSSRQKDCGDSANYEEYKDSDTHLASAYKIRNKRPTSPPRPVTAPTRMNSLSPPRRPSSRRDNHNHNQVSTTGSRRQTKDKSCYYYSASDDEKIGIASTFPSRGHSGGGSHPPRVTQVKQVSFRESRSGDPPVRNRADTQRLFPPVKSSLKKYC